MSDKDLMDLVEQGQLKTDCADFSIGDTVDVHVKIVEGEKERIQIFTGTVIAKGGTGINAAFTVRRLVGSEGVERIFPAHSPSVVKVHIKKRGRVRRAKLYYLRDRVGKATRVAEKRSVAGAVSPSSAATPSKAEPPQSKEAAKPEEKQQPEPEKQEVGAAE